MYTNSRPQRPHSFWSTAYGDENDVYPSLGGRHIPSYERIGYNMHMIRLSIGDRKTVKNRQA